MTSIFPRACFALLSTMGAAALVAFVDPANAVGSVRSAPHAAIVAATTPVAIAHRG